MRGSSVPKIVTCRRLSTPFDRCNFLLFAITLLTLTGCRLPESTSVNSESAPTTTEEGSLATTENKLTLEAFEQIQIGVSDLPYIETLLGPGTLEAETPTLKTYGWCENTDDIPGCDRFITVRFRGGVAYTKSQLGID